MDFFLPTNIKIKMQKKKKTLGFITGLLYYLLKCTLLFVLYSFVKYFEFKLTRQVLLIIKNIFLF
jgi:hypothetical protein